MRNRDEANGEAQFIQTFEAFYAAQYRAVLAMLTASMSNRWLAEELTQEAFLRVHLAWDMVSNHPNPDAWVRRVALNLSHSKWKRMTNELKILSNMRPRGVVDEDSSVVLDLLPLVQSLPRRQREVVVLYYFDDCPTSQIAEILGLKEGTIRATLHQARRGLAKQMGKER